MLAEESLRNGDLESALTQLQDLVRKDPAKAEYRIFLFQLLSALGQWSRASNQLSVLRDMHPQSLAMVTLYTEALKCEVLRTEVFEGKRSPLLFGEPEAWMASLLQSLQLSGQGLDAEADKAREQAFEAAPTTRGTIDGQGFEWIADADSRIGPMLEAIINGKYYWVPFKRLAQINIEAPVDLRDLVWTLSRLTFSNGGEAVAMIPTRYVGSERSTDRQIQMARKTEWIERGGTIRGLGQRMLATDAGEFALLAARKITLETSEPGATVES